MYVLICNEYSVDACIGFKSRAAAKAWAERQGFERYEIRFVTQNAMGL